MAVNRTFKIVGRYSERCRFHLGKLGLQAKKRVYTSLEDFERFAPETMKRWTEFCGFNVDAQELIDGKWVSVTKEKS